VGNARERRATIHLDGGSMVRKLATVAIIAATLTLSGCGYNTLQTQDEQVKAGWSEVVNQYQRRADLIPNLVNTVKGYAAQEQQVLTEVTRARANATEHPGDAGAPQQPGGVPEVPAGAGRAVGRAVAAHGRRREVPRPQVRRAVPRPAGAARGHREPDHRRAQPLHQDRAGLQHDGALVPDQPDGDAVQDGREAQLHGRERGGDREAAGGRLRQDAAAPDKKS
jgi:hypothetical protein